MRPYPISLGFMACLRSLSSFPYLSHCMLGYGHGGGSGSGLCTGWVAAAVHMAVVMGSGCAGLRLRGRGAMGPEPGTLYNRLPM